MGQNRREEPLCHGLCNDILCYSPNGYRPENCKSSFWEIRGPKGGECVVKSRRTIFFGLCVHRHLSCTSFNKALNSVKFGSALPDVSEGDELVPNIWNCKIPSYISIFKRLIWWVLISIKALLLEDIVWILYKLLKYPQEPCCAPPDSWNPFATLVEKKFFLQFKSTRKRFISTRETRS